MNTFVIRKNIKSELLKQIKDYISTENIIDNKEVYFDYNRENPGDVLFFQDWIGTGEIDLSAKRVDVYNFFEFDELYLIIKSYRGFDKTPFIKYYGRVSSLEYFKSLLNNIELLSNDIHMNFITSTHSNINGKSDLIKI